MEKRGRESLIDAVRELGDLSLLELGDQRLPFPLMRILIMRSTKALLTTLTVLSIASERSGNECRNKKSISIKHLVIFLGNYDKTYFKT